MAARSIDGCSRPCLAALWALAAAWQITPERSAAAADAPAHRATCVETDAPTSSALGPRLKRANALIDQGCYKDAAAVLEAAALLYPTNAEVAGKLRDVRSMLTEDTYIQDMTRAEDAAKLQHSQLRCKQFGDLAACDESLKASPNDASLLAAKADALQQAGHAQDAAALYARAAQLNPTDNALRAKLTAAQRESAAAVPTPSAVVPARAPPAARRRLARTTVTPRAHETKPPLQPAVQEAPPAAASAVVYSNEAPPGRSN